MSSPRQILRAAGANWVALVVSFVTAFFLTPFVIHHLGPVNYGVWTLVVAMVSYFGLFDLGLRSAVTRFVASDSARSEHESASRAVSAVFWLRFWTAVLILCGTVSISFFASRVFQIPPELQFATRWAILFSGASLSLSMSFGVFGGVLVGRHRFDILSAISIGQTLLRAAGMVVLLKAHLGILAIAIWEFAGVTIVGIVTVLVSFRVYPELRISLQTPDWETARKIGSHSLYAFIASVGVQFVYYTDNLVVGTIVGVAAVTVYAIGGNIIEYLRQIVSSLTQTFAPLASRLGALDQASQMRNLLIFGTRAALAIALPVEAALFFRGPTFIGLWVGPQFAHDSGRVLQILLCAQLVGLANFTAGNIVFGIGKHKPVAIWAICEAICNLVLSILLARSMGVFGVAWGTAIPSVLIQLLFWPPYISRVLDIAITEYLWQAWVRSLLAVIPFAVGCYLSDRYWPARNLLWFFCQMATLLPLYILGLLLCFHAEFIRVWRSRGALPAGQTVKE
jgi:O-antigen/teichoic acid export membrane protein